MIDIKAYAEIRERGYNINGKFEAYNGIHRMAVLNAEQCIENNNLDVAETWITIANYCNQKVSECKNQLEDVEAELLKMKERDLA